VSGGTVLEGLLASLSDADDASVRQLANYLRPYLADDPARLLGLAEKAEQLGLHPDTLRGMARKKRIWAVKVGREWRFRADRSEIRPAIGSPFPVVNGSSPRRRAPTPTPASVAAIRGSQPATEHRP
jgi:excisionase family DNA binding protein